MPDIYDTVNVDVDEPVRLSFYLDKGGVGKTTSAAGSAVSYEELGLDTVLVDLSGTQSDLAKQFGFYDQWKARIEAEDNHPEFGEYPDWPNISTVFTADWDRISKLADDPIGSMTFDTGEGPDLIPAHPGLDGVDDDLASIDKPDRYWILDSFITESLEPHYDVVIVDLPGDTSNITLNGLFATQSVITPMKMDAFEAEQLNALMDELGAILENHGVAISLDLIVPTMVDTRINVDTELLSDLDDELQEFVAPEPIPNTADVKNSKTPPRPIKTVLDQVDASSPGDLLVDLSDDLEGIDEFLAYIAREWDHNVSLESVDELRVAVDGEPQLLEEPPLGRLFYEPDSPETMIGTIFNMDSDARLDTGERLVNAYRENVLYFLEHSPGVVVEREEVAADA